LLCLFAALCASLARFQPDLPLYLDHVQERLMPILQAVRKSSPSIDRLGAWLNPGNILQVNIRGPSFLELALKDAPKFFLQFCLLSTCLLLPLLYGARLLKKLVDMIPGVSEKQNVVEIAAEIVWISVGLLGLPHPLLWGVAAFLLHYIPFVGATGGILAMTLVSFIHFDSAWYALLPPLAICLCAMIEGNLATPLFLGRWLTLNPIAILLTFLLWSYLWGVTGTLLAVLLLATFKIFCDRIAPLRRVGSFLGRP
jgi:predicted PurR-regulated permease PerM